MARGDPWSAEEVRATIADYFEMFRLHLDGAGFTKTDRYRTLAARFPGRTWKAFEWKAQNVSAALLLLRRPFLPGLAPAANLQALVIEELERYLAAHPDWDQAFRDAAERDAGAVAALLPSAEELAGDLASVAVPPPRSAAARPGRADRVAGRAPRVGVDYLAMEAANRSLGAAGEEFALRYEIARLLAAGRESLAGRVEHVARTRGDGLGFDILSYEPDSRERFVEVKTTGYAAETPFYVTANELDVSTREADRYHLLRVFDFPRPRTAAAVRLRRPRLFSLSGQMDRSCDLSPSVYRARVR